MLAVVTAASRPPMARRPSRPVLVPPSPGSLMILTPRIPASPCASRSSSLISVADTYLLLTSRFTRIGVTLADDDADMHRPSSHYQPNHPTTGLDWCPRGHLRGSHDGRWVLYRRHGRIGDRL